jgi:mRNA-degrading endonuclease RelE of RelBE toxin-antitoxin system
LRIIPTRDFAKAFKRLAKDKQKATERALAKLGSEPPAPSLKIRLLQSSDGLWIANVSGIGYRIIFARPDEQSAELLDVGEHDATYRKWNRRK